MACTLRIVVRAVHFCADALIAGRGPSAGSLPARYRGPRPRTEQTADFGPEKAARPRASAARWRQDAHAVACLSGQFHWRRPVCRRCAAPQRLHPRQRCRQAKSPSGSVDKSVAIKSVAMTPVAIPCVAIPSVAKRRPLGLRPIARAIDAGDKAACLRWR